MAGATDSTKKAISTAAALRAVQRGYQPIPIRSGKKSPHISAWTHVRWSAESLADVEKAFERWAAEGAANVGLLLGEASNGLIDIDIDHPKASRMKEFFLPPTGMRSGRPGRPSSHYWYRVEGDLPGTRRYRMPDGSVSVELRSTGSQTLIPPSTHPSGERYRWEDRRWGEPAVMDGRVLAVQVALLALGSVLLENWPKAGSRHDAYLALAGGLLRFGNGVHPFWERNASVLIRALAMATDDDDGPDAREKEVLATTLAKLRVDTPVTGFTTLAKMIGNEHAELVRRHVREVESLAGFMGEPEHPVEDASVDGPQIEHEGPLPSTLPPEERDPLSERLGTWQAVDMDPYLSGQVQIPEPRILRRSDGRGLFYEGRVNSLYGQSEAAKSWIALIACQQEMAMGERVMYIDLEDEPTFTLMRLRMLGCGDDDVRHQFTYVRPEDPIKDMQRNRFGGVQETEGGRQNYELFQQEMAKADPRLIIVDGMTVLYGLHGLDSNDAVSTDIITTWLKRLCRNGKSTVIVIDHTGKGAQRGASPIGAHHKIAMVQGTAIQAHPIKQPMPHELGEVELLVYKDRPGVVRSISTRTKPATAAIVTLDSRDGVRTIATVDPPDPDDIILGDGAQEQALASAAARLDREARRQEAARIAADLLESDMEAFEALLSGNDPMSMAEIIDGLGVIGEERAQAARSRLLETGRIVRHSNKRWARYGLPPEKGRA